MQNAPTFLTSITTPSVLASSNDSGALGASGTAFSDLFLASGGTINWNAGDVIITHAANSLAFSGASNGYTFDAGVLPSANDAAALGAAATSWSDLFLASGALIGFANGNVVLTHSSGILTVSTGDLRVTTAGTNTASVVTVGGTQTLTNKTLTAPNIGGQAQLAENASIALDQTLSADGTYSGITIDGTAGTTLAFGDLIYLAAADSRWELTDADAAATADVLIGMCVLAAASDGSPTRILLQGNIRADAAFPTMTVSARMYMGETAGDIQATIPTGADAVIRSVGYALTADSLYFCPSMDSQITVA